jgi:hypothetical protein
MNANNYNAKFMVGIGPTITLMLFSTLVVQAQDPDQLREMFATAQQQNEQALRQYTWKSLNEIKKNGESENKQLFLMHYDALGNIQKSRLGGSATRAMPRGPIMRSMAKKKRGDLIELIDGLREQVEAYNHIPPEKMPAFLASATITARMNQGVVQIQGENILQRGDSMSIWLDTRTRKQRRVEINTFLDKNPVKAVTEFSDLPTGPTYIARTVVDYPKDALQLITENFDYELARD